MNDSSKEKDIEKDILNNYGTFSKKNKKNPK